MTDPCPCCGRLPLGDDPAAAEALLTSIRATDRERLLRLESWQRVASVEDRVAVIRFLERLLGAPPLLGVPKGTARIVSFLALAVGDLRDLAWDPAEAPVEGAVVPSEHPLLGVPLPDPDEPSSAGDPRTQRQRIEALMGELGWT